MAYLADPASMRNHRRWHGGWQVSHSTCGASDRSLFEDHPIARLGPGSPSLSPLNAGRLRRAGKSV